MASDPVKIGLIGCGEVCEHKHLQALCQLDQAHVVALADPDPARARHVAGRYGIAEVFPDTSSLIRAGVAEVVGVLTPPGQHREPAIQAMEAGLHVLVEKPIALSIADADALIHASRSHDVKVLMGFHMRWHRLVRRAFDDLRSGAVGAVESIRTVWNSPRGDDGTPAWKWTREQGGGSLVELGVHLYDLWRHLLGTEVTEVFAWSRHGSRHDESAQVTARLADTTLASATLSERTGHEMEVEVCGSGGRLRVSGVRFDGYERYGRRETPGMVGPRLRNLRTFARDLPVGVARMRRLGDYGDSYVGEWRHLLECARSGHPVACTLEDGRAALRVALAAAESANRGAPIRVADAPSAMPSADAVP